MYLQTHLEHKFSIRYCRTTWEEPLGNWLLISKIYVCNQLADHPKAGFAAPVIFRFLHKHQSSAQLNLVILPKGN